MVKSVDSLNGSVLLAPLRVSNSFVSAGASCPSPPAASASVAQPSSAALDVSADSLPSPHSESFPSEEDPSCPARRERRRREGGKKKKKDRDKEDGSRKRKKHHRERHSLGEMASEMVSPFRIKVSTGGPSGKGIRQDACPTRDGSGRMGGFLHLSVA